MFLSTIQQPFCHRRHTPWESQGTSGEGEFFLRKLWISQDSVVFYCGFISPSLSTTSVFFFFGFVRVDYLYAEGASSIFVTILRQISFTPSWFGLSPENFLF